MIRAYSAAQIRTAETRHLEAGVPLMQRAAAELAREVGLLLPPGGGQVLLIVGGGNNGGDALFAGAELATGGTDVVIIRTADRIHSEGLAAALGSGAHLAEPGSTAALAATADVIVDGIHVTGSGASPALRGKGREVVAAILPVLERREAGPPLVVAVDLPSGIGPDDGSLPEPVVLPADLTVTFGAYKAGLLLEPASRLVGRVHLVEIGIEADLALLDPMLTIDDRNGARPISG